MACALVEWTYKIKLDIDFRLYDNWRITWSQCVYVVSEISTDTNYNIDKLSDLDGGRKYISVIVVFTKDCIAKHTESSWSTLI